VRAFRHGIKTILIALFVITLLPLIANAQPGGGRPHGGGPPQEAFSACRGVQNGGSCSFQAPFGQLQGRCLDMQSNGRLHCVPEHHTRGANRNNNQDMRRTPPGRENNFRENRGGAQDREEFQRTSQSRRRGPPGYQPRTPWPQATLLNNKIPDSGQVTCFNNSQVTDCTEIGSSFFGQDAHYKSSAPTYRDAGDGTVRDLITGLLWQKKHNPVRVNRVKAENVCNKMVLGGYRDWRLPSIKELFSIADFSGVTGQRYFINSIFDLEPPDASILRGDRFASTHSVEMMGQTWSSTSYVGPIMNRRAPHSFFFNFLDGRIKNAPTNGRNGLFYRCVRGDEWGHNRFEDNLDKTVTDHFSALMWQQVDSGKSRNWQGAISYCENMELAGHDDWRLPNIKELQSIVDYRRNDPAIDANFFKQQDKQGWFWSSTTHGDNPNMAGYICFGKCTSIDGVDVHGAGAQRSDPKSGEPSRWGSLGGQRDAVRIQNHARCVRDSK
jgi:hypothetical protein